MPKFRLSRSPGTAEPAARLANGCIATASLPVSESVSVGVAEAAAACAVRMEFRTTVTCSCVGDGVPSVADSNPVTDRAEELR